MAEVVDLMPRKENERFWRLVRIIGDINLYFFYKEMLSKMQSTNKEGRMLMDDIRERARGQKKRRFVGGGLRIPSTRKEGGEMSPRVMFSRLKSIASFVRVAGFK